MICSGIPPQPTFSGKKLMFCMIKFQAFYCILYKTRFFFTTLVFSDVVMKGVYLHNFYHMTKMCIPYLKLKMMQIED